MNQTIFNDLVEKPKNRKKWLFFPLSVLFHALIIAVAVAIPLLSTIDSMPEVVYTTVKLAPPLPPKVMVNKGGGGGRKQKTVKKAEKQKKIIHRDFKLRIPEIPDEIIEEDLDNFAAEFGDGPYIPGAPAGDPNGVPGAPDIFMPNDLNSQDVIPITNVQKPRLLKKIEPLYPRPALLARVQGTVVIEAVTDISGKVVKTDVISGHPLLKQAAVQAVMQWIYEPYIFNGIPKPVVFTVNVTFRLQK